MKKLFVLLVACTIATTASAQFVNSGNVKSGSSSSNAIFSATDDYNRIYFGYNPTSIEWEDNQRENEEIIPLKSSLSLGYLHASNIAQNLPLFIEYGANLQYSFGKFSDSGEDWSDTTKVNMFSMNIPVNLAFKFKFNDCALTPYVGLNFRVNMAGKYKYEYEYDDYYDGRQSGSENLDIFDDSDKDNAMGDMAAKRFQAGINVGVGFSYKALYLGVGYVSDFSKIIDYSDGDMVGKIGVTTLTLGINF